MRHVLISLATTVLASVAFVGSASADYYDDAYASTAESSVLVLSGGNWYAATIWEFSGGVYLVHYDGTGSESDEWVDASRIRSIDGSAFVYAYDPVVQVYLGSQWYDGRVLGRRGNSYQVRYNGGDRWFTAGQLRMHARGHAARGWSNVRRGGGAATWHGHKGAPSAWNGRGGRGGGDRGGHSGGAYQGRPRGGDHQGRGSSASGQGRGGRGGGDHQGRGGGGGSGGHRGGGRGGR